MEDIRGQQLAYNTHLDTVRADHQRTLTVEIEKQTVQHQSNLGKKLLTRKIINHIHVNETNDLTAERKIDCGKMRINL
jgi:hypothetical protein